MDPRIELAKTAPGAVAAMGGLETCIHGSGLEPALLELVTLRASQINGRAHCLDMHGTVARAAGEREQRPHTPAAWRETRFFGERERAALAWTGAVTPIGRTHAPDDLFQSVRGQFSEHDLVDPTLAVVAINRWDRLAIAFRSVPGACTPELSPETPARFCCEGRSRRAGGRTRGSARAAVRSTYGSNPHPYVRPPSSASRPSRDESGWGFRAEQVTGGRR